MTIVGITYFLTVTVELRLFFFVILKSLCLIYSCATFSISRQSLMRVIHQAYQFIHRAKKSMLKIGRRQEGENSVFAKKFCKVLIVI